MRKLVVTNNLTLDGVMQAPGRADEDTSDGFCHGGWGVGYDDAVRAQEMGRGMATGGALLFGRRTYEDFYRVWPNRTDNPYSAILDNSPKYVVSTTLTEPLPWKNSTLVSGDVPGSIARLKQGTGKDLVVLGSGRLVQSLLAHDLVDRLVLLIHPIVMGAGRRLFAGDGHLAKFRLERHVATTTGVIIATYDRA